MSADRFRRRRASGRVQHPAPAPPGPLALVYVDGAYVISEAGEATTWAVCDHGRWGVIFECSGVEILSAWVQPSDLPLHVLAEALQGAAR